MVIACKRYPVESTAYSPAMSEVAEQKSEKQRFHEATFVIIKKSLM